MRLIYMCRKVTAGLDVVPTHLHVALFHPCWQESRTPRSLVALLRSASDRALAHPRWLVLLAAVLVYANTIQNQPVLDDTWAIFDNPLVKHLDQVGAIFRHSYGFAAHGTLYRPLTILSYAVNWAIGGLNVVGYHVGNLALHVLCSLLVFNLVVLLCKAAGWHEAIAGLAALLSALLFAIHPVHVEAVTYLKGRDELLAASGALGCLYLTATRRVASWRYPAALVALAAGVLGKENAAVTPLLFGLIGLTLPLVVDLEVRPRVSSPEGRRALSHLCALTAGMAAVVGVCVLLRPPSAAIPLEERWFGNEPSRVVFSTMTRVMAEYWRLLVFPTPLANESHYADIIPLTPSFTVTCVADTAVWVSVLALGVAWLRRVPLLGVGVVWVFIALLPVVNIIRIGVLMAERLLYLPSVGFCVFVGASVSVLPRRIRGHGARSALTVGVAAVGVLLAVKTWTRNAEWRDGLSLWRAAVRLDPKDPIANNNLAYEYMTRGELDSAGGHVMVALAVAPEWWSAWLNAGLLAHRLHHDSAATRSLEQAHALAPAESDPLFFLGVVRGDEGRLPEAVDLLSQAEGLRPAEAWTRVCRGWYLKRLGRAAEGDAEVKRALELDPAVSLGSCVTMAH